MNLEINVLDSRSVEAAIKAIQAYQDSLIEKCHTLLDRLINEVGLPVVSVRVKKAQGDSDKDYTVIKDWDISDPNTEAVTLRINGHQLVFIEFGAGRYYNGGPSIVGDSPHDLGKDLGFTIGSWYAGPGYDREYSQGENDSWDSPVGLSHGTQSTAPVYKAAQAMEAEVVRIAQEVFSEGR